ncbi:MAG: N-acyl-D-amino-acid deacylase family protein, partial [Planctomyces sp.]
PVDVGQYLDQVDRDGAGTNIAHLLPQGSLRARVMGPQSGRATSEQMMTMLSLTEKAMKEGAFGISTGLIYIPGTFTETEELIELSRVVAAHHGFYASHIRNEGDELSASLEEAIRIGETANLPVHISHLKCSGTSNWGRMRLALEQIRSARSRGLKVTADQYPYAASSTSLDATLLPSWARDGGRPELTKRLNDPAISAKIRDELVRSLQKASRIQIAACSAFPQFVGKSLDEIAAAENAENPDVAELVLRIERNGGAAVVNFAMSEEDVRMAMPVDWVATASDGGSKVPGPTLPHPRSFGTFPRKIGLYARDLDVLTVAAAIRSATGLPAEILGLKERGTLKKDSAADIAVFHPDTFIDRATYDEPWLPPEGMRYVLVNGRFAVYAGQATGILAGRSLRKQSQKTSESGES